MSRGAVTDSDLRGFGQGVKRPLVRRDDARVAVAGVLLGATIVAASSLGASALVLLTSLAAMAVSIVSPIIGIVVLAMVAPVPRPLVVPPPGLWMLMTGAILFGVILRLPIDRPRFRTPPPEVWVVVAFLAYVVAHIMATVLAEGSLGRGYSMASGFEDVFTGMLLLLIAGVVLRDRSPWPVIAALLVSAIYASAASLLPIAGIEGVFGDLADASVPARRAVGIFNDANYFGAYLAAAVTLAVACAAIVESSRVRLLLIAVAALFSLALLATLSRGAIAALFVGLITIAFFRSPKAGLITVAVMALVGVLGYPIFSDARYSSIPELADASALSQFESSGRLGTWAAGLQAFESSPIFGVGFGNFVEESGISAHSWYFSVLAEGGLVGIGLWALLIAMIILALRRTSRPARTVGFAVLASWLVAAVFLDLPRFYQSTGLVVFSLAAALAAEWVQRGQAPGEGGSA